jgi:two-component system, chemotaxis family, chemotaxis protein CheY
MAKQKTILIVDDSTYQRTKAKNLLLENGFNVVEADDGIEGVHLYRSVLPDLVLMDINMPIMEGTDALRYIRKMDSNAIVIMFSTLDDEKTVMEAIKAGALDYIVKPLNPPLMLETINKFLDRAALKARAKK